MRHRSGLARTFAVATLTCAIAWPVACAIVACAGRESAARPVASLPSSPQAAAAFDAIREAWRDPDRIPPAVLRAKIETFLARFPTDGLHSLARVALAFVAMKGGDLATADVELAATARLPPGTTHDLRTIATARRLRLRGDPEAALALLRPLVGKNVDPLARAIFEEDLTLTALATHREYEAISYMDAWLRASSEDEKAEAIKRVTEIVQRLPKDVLVGALQAMRAQRASLGYGVDIQRILAERLVQIATTSGDAELARTLLEADPEAFAVAGDAGAALGELATSRRGLNVVEGRTLGLLLPTESPGLRDESADVLRGVLWALGLPRGTREAALPAGADAGAKGPTSAPCAALEAAPDLAEPKAEDGTRLVTRDDSGSADRTEVSLDELAGQGAAIVIAGLDGKTADRALRWGQNHGVPVVALVPPDPLATGAALAPFGFVLGEPRTHVLATLARAAPGIAGETVAPIADSSELAFYPPQGGPLAGLNLGPPVSCDIPSVRAGEARFPITQWQAERTHAWIVSGSADCAADLVTELSASRARGIVALTLEAATVMRSAPGLRIVSAEAGIVPAVDPRDPRDEEVRRFSTVLGHAGWWTALGRDAATLARGALLQLPADSVSESRAVAARRAAARDHLAGARARLWTTEAATWSEDRTMKRTLCTVDTPAR